MTPHDRAAEEARNRRYLEFAELEEKAGPILAAGGLVWAQKFPPPDTEGMTPEQREAALAKWRADIAAWQRERDSDARATAPARPSVPASSATLPPEVPAS